MTKIVLDVYGADAGVGVIIRGALKALHQREELAVVFVGERSLIEEYLKDSGIDAARMEILHTDDHIKGDEPPTVLFGGRDNSSMALSLARLKEDPECVGMLSAGSTGALLVGSIFRLGLIEGLKSPALSSYLPMARGDLVCLLDCGANIQCTPKELARFALMGNAFVRCMTGKDAPRVGLLNVGTEKGKGTPVLQQAYDLIQALPLNFIGNIEGSDMVQDKADVIVADGVSGNILLKSAEAAGLTARGVVEHFKAQMGEAAPEVLDSIMDYLHNSFNYNALGGATFLGTQKTVIKMHGCATEDTVLACIDQLSRLHKAGFAEKIKEALQTEI